MKLYCSNCWWEREINDSNQKIIRKARNNKCLCPECKSRIQLIEEKEEETDMIDTNKVEDKDNNSYKNKKGENKPNCTTERLLKVHSWVTYILSSIILVLVGLDNLPQGIVLVISPLVLISYPLYMHIIATMGISLKKNQ